MKIILASASPRRKQLLNEIISGAEVCPCDKEETHPCLPPKDYVKYLSEQKAEYVFDAKKTQAEQTKTDLLVIGSDTIVVLDKKIIGKPKDKDEASFMLNSLSGRTHKVFTGVCLLTKEKKKSFCVCAKVKFFKLSQAQIDDYIASGSPFDKAGAYGIQDSGFVKKIVGSVSCVMGLPKEKLSKELKKLGLKTI